MPDALMLFTLLLAVVLAVSGAAKLRDPESARDGFAALGVPPAFSRPWIVAALPWVEVGLAVLLLVTGGVFAVAVGAAVLALFLAYLILVARVVARGVDASCGCFGSLTGGRVTGWTVARNAGYLAAAFGSLVASVILPAPLLVRLAGAGQGSLAWLGVALLVAVMAALTVYERPAEVAEAEPAPADVFTDEEGEYVRLPIPYAALQDLDGQPAHLRSLARTRARLLVFVSTTCGSCESVIASFPQWRADVPTVGLHLVVSSRPQVDRLPEEVRDSALVDEGRSVAQLFESRGTPWAVLLGADLLLAGGPVTGPIEVGQLVQDIKDQLAESSAAS
jgi:hypothetical protein